MEKQSRIEQIAEIGALLLLVVGCYWVIRPFIVAVAWAAILCFSTWPVYHWVKTVLKDRQPQAALAMTLLIALVVVIPLTLLVLSLTDDIKALVTKVPELLQEGLPDPPAWLVNVPWMGEYMTARWQDMAHSGPNVQAELKQFLGHTQGWFVERSLSLGHGILQLCLSLFITFFFYRDGVAFVDNIQKTIGKTIKGVVYGILGTAIAQAILAFIGFWGMNFFLPENARIPVPLVLGLVTFVAALIPFGPPLIWLPVCGWLFWNGQIIPGIIMFMWGAGVVSFIDNLLKPYLISRESKMPFIMVFLGVLGGVIAFGFIGVFLGPTLLSVGYTLLDEWVSTLKKNRYQTKVLNV
jgi:predicted PurR-regulated permease PerM